MIFLLLFVACTCTRYQLLEVVAAFNGVEGIGVGQKYVGVGDYDGYLYIYKRQKQQLSLHQTIAGKSINRIWDVAMTQDHWLATAAEFDSSVYMLNNSTQQFTLMQSFPQKKVHSVQISADHSYLVLGDNECYVYIYKLENGKYEKQQEIESPPTTFCEVFSMSLTADGRDLVVGRSGNFVNVYSNQGNNFTLTLTLQFQDFAFRRVKLTNDGKCLAIASKSFSQTNYSNLFVYKRPHSNFQLWQNITDFGPAYAVDMTEDCQQLVIGSSYSTLYFESDSQQKFTQVQTLPAQSSQYVICSKFVDKGESLLSGARVDGRLYVYARYSQFLTSW